MQEYYSIEAATLKAVIRGAMNTSEFEQHAKVGESMVGRILEAERNKILSIAGKLKEYDSEFRRVATFIIALAKRQKRLNRKKLRRQRLKIGRAHV